MKTNRLLKGFSGISIIIGLLFLPASKSFGQSTASNVATVNIRATDPLGTLSGDTAAFTFFRSSGPTNTDLNVYYTIGGTASNGVDYQSIGNFILLSAGMMSNKVVIVPVNHEQSNTESIILHLAPSPLMTPVNYIIGSPDTAAAYITPSVSNFPPISTITSPTDGSVFTAPADISIIALGADLDGSVVSMEFLANGRSLGSVSNWVMVDPPGPGKPFIPGTRAFFFDWTNVPALPPIAVTNQPPPNSAPGTPPIISSVTPPYILTAKATDNGGATGLSAPVRVFVLPKASNLPPVVRITSPPDHAFFLDPVDIPLFAYARDLDGSISSVAFYDGSNFLGYGNTISPTPIPIIPTAYTTPVSPAALSTPPVTIVPPTNLYVFVWSNVPVGPHQLTAVATDNIGADNTSPTVNITVLQRVPPPSNRPAIVSIVATDPIAIAGTNCWTWLGLSGVPPTWSNWVSATAVLNRFTNCGPKNAIFTVRRLGDTNDDLNIGYSIGGTASNGVDYVTLPGLVTLPAGQRTAQITIVPLDEEPPTNVAVVVATANSLVTNIVSISNCPRPATVILALKPAPSPTNYVIGKPAKAEAIIIDSDHPIPPSVLPDSTFHLTSTGPDGAWFHIDYSTDLLNWSSLCTNQIIGGAIDFVDPEAASNSARFYRAVPELNPPSQ